MLKTLSTLLRGAVAEAEDAVFDANAIRMLEQQLRDAAAALELSRRELACAIAHQSSEERAIAALSARIGELEGGARDALASGRDDLAEETSVVIAATEDERSERRLALEVFSKDVRRLKQLAQDGQARLGDLRRGLEIARAQESLRRAGANGRRALASGSGALRDAEATLVRIRENNRRDDDVATALDELEKQQSAQSISEKLAAAGFGRKLKSSPADVMARLRRSAKPEGDK